MDLRTWFNENAETCSDLPSSSQERFSVSQSNNQIHSPKLNIKQNIINQDTRSRQKMFARKNSVALSSEKESIS